MKLSHGPVNVLECGATGDGVTDDTGAIQEAINWVCPRGGGKIVFPFTPTGYRIASPAAEAVDGRRCRSQLYIPFLPDLRPNIAFEGEMPCRILYSYMVRPTTRFPLQNTNTFLFSDWQAPEEHDPLARPWSLLGGLEGDSFRGRFGVGNVSIRNLEFRTRLDPDRMYPTESAVNLQNVSRVNIQDSQFCLDRNVGDIDTGQCLQENPCHAAGLICSGDQNDDNVLRNVAVQGYRYGFVLGEHVIAEYLYVHNCEQGIVFHDSSHQSFIQHVVAQHDRVILATTETELFGMNKGPCHVDIGSIDFEPGFKHRPPVSTMQYGVWDPENRLRGALRYHCGCPCGLDFFPVRGGARMLCSRTTPA
jgi:hypothetical protein